jgi:tryptophanyl-tRNA synthetase
MKRILSGMRPTGPLHVGHYFGALQNWVALQGQYESYHFVADWHVLTDHQGDLGDVRRWSREMIADWIACGLDPDRATLYIQSEVPETLELAWVLGSLAWVGDLERCPTYKDVLGKSQNTPPYALLGYPVLQCADIAIVKGDFVPVGEDQVSHLEICREIIRRFNKTYGEVFPEMQPKLTAVPRLVGTDGQAKMSKSLDNCIYLSDDAATVERRVRGMYTDPKRVRADIPGTVEGNPVFIYHDLFNTNREEVEDLKARYRAGRVGDVEVKKKLAAAINGFLEPIRRRRAEILARPKELDERIAAGGAKARETARRTMADVRDALYGKP